MTNFILTFALLWYGLRYDVYEAVIASAMFSIAFQLALVANAIRKLVKPETKTEYGKQGLTKEEIENVSKKL